MAKSVAARTAFVALAVLILVGSCGQSAEDAQEAAAATQTYEAAIQRGIQETQQASLPSPTPTIPPPTPSPVPTATATSRPRPTATPEGLMQFDGQTCYRWDMVTLDDVGRSLCVWGRPVKQRVDKQNGVTWLYFGEDRGSFQFVLYAQEGYYETWDFGSHDCVYLDGEVHRIGDTPVITIQGNTIWLCN